MNSVSLMYVAHLFEYIATDYGSLFKPSSYSLIAYGYLPSLNKSFPASMKMVLIRKLSGNFYIPSNPFGTVYFLDLTIVLSTLLKRNMVSPNILQYGVQRIQ